MDAFDLNPQGYWFVDDKKFLNKYQALMYAAPLKKAVHYHYFNDVWNNFNRDLLGKFSLTELYKQRAEQLRSKYDYLILYFSGGADSYNVLRSFIDNNIKLDEVCVKWCMDSLNSNTQIYQPNTENKTAYNYLSEWDYAIKPVLEELAQTNPEIKIQIVDWFKEKDYSTVETAFTTVNHWHDSEVNSLAVWSPTEKELIEKGLKVGSIYGVDKPNIIYEDTKAYLYFPDSATTMGSPNPANPYGTEYFYYAPDLPLLIFEMAHMAIKATVYNQRLKKYKLTRNLKEDAQFLVDSNQIYQKEIRHVLYDNWTDRFQALKPVFANRQDKHWWIYKHNELSRYRDLYEDLAQDHIRQLEKLGSWYTYRLPTDSRLFYKVLPTKTFFVCDID
jgi:hypothetical protein